MNFKKNYKQTAIIIIVLSFVSKGVGFIRESLLASTYGLSSEYDTFLLFFMVPTFIFATINYSVSYTLNPYYNKLKNNYNKEVVGSNITRIIFWTLIASVFVTSILSYSPIFFVKNIFGIYEIEKINFYNKIFIFSIWMIPSYVGISILQTVLQAEEYIYTISITPILQSIIVIIFTIFFKNDISFLQLSWLIGSYVWFFVLLYQFLNSEVCKLNTRKLFKPIDDHMILGKSFVIVTLIELWPQLNIVIDRLILSWNNLEVGSISSLNYTTSLYSMTLALFFATYAQAVFPYISAYTSGDKTEETNFILNKSIRLVSMLSILITAILFSNTDHIIQVLYERGNFDINAHQKTSVLSKLYFLELPFDAIYSIFLTIIYSQKKYKILIFAGLISIVLKVALSYLLVNKFGTQALIVSTIIGLSVRTIMVAFSYNEIKQNFSYDFVISIIKLIVVLIVVIFLIKFIENRFLFNKIENLKALMLIFSKSFLVILIYLYAGYKFKIKEFSRFSIKNLF
jgi:putative peptidoglycan lipid II flippase